MVRKTFVILAVAATIGGAALSPTDAFARWGGVGWGGGGWRGGVAIGRVGGMIVELAQVKQQRSEYGARHEDRP